MSFKLSLPPKKSKVVAPVKDTKGEWAVCKHIENLDIPKKPKSGIQIGKTKKELEVSKPLTQALDTIENLELSTPEPPTLTNEVEPQKLSIEPYKLFVDGSTELDPEVVTEFEKRMNKIQTSFSTEDITEAVMRVFKYAQEHRNIVTAIQPKDIALIVVAARKSYAKTYEKKVANRVKRSKKQEEADSFKAGLGTDLSEFML